jgi:hypothetical protein
VEPPKNPGKILLLYSPDTEAFKELQTSFKSFLELACHCVVLDLFDEKLFQDIAFDPEAWLTRLLADPDFKVREAKETFYNIALSSSLFCLSFATYSVARNSSTKKDFFKFKCPTLLFVISLQVIVVCSEGAFKRQLALLSGEVLNIPNSSSTLDGLFSAGLKFFQAKHAYDYNRLALVRFEMLALCAEKFRLAEMVPNREFLVPTMLHDVFCWIHGYDPLDLLGKPWDRYHLELQLLQDALKQARKENNYSDGGR